MSSVPRYIVLAILVAMTFSAKAQCPTLGTLLAGGTFNDGMGGPISCNYTSVGAVSTTGNINFTGSITMSGVTSFTIANNFVWNGGLLDLQGTGFLIVGNGTTGSLTINSGTVRTNDGIDGTVYAAANSSISIQSSASLVARTMDFEPASSVTNSGTITGSDFVLLAGNLTNSGTITLTHTSNDITIGGTTTNTGQINAAHDVIVAYDVGAPYYGNLTVGAGGSITADNFHIDGGGITVVQSGGSITANDNTASTDDEDDNIIEGSLTSWGTLSFNGDIVVQGSIASMTINGGTVTVTRPADGDLEVTGGATFTMNAGTVTLPDDLTTAGSTANFVINGGTLNIFDDLAFSGGSFENNGTILADDIKMTGGTFHNLGSGSITISERDGNTSADLEVSGGTFENDGNINIADDLLINGSPGGTFFNDEMMTVGDDINVSGSGRLRSHEAGAVINLGDDYADASCPAANGEYHYCAPSCLGLHSSSTICASALPIELLSFAGTQNGTQIHLTWTTATETNNDFFTIQKLTTIDLFEEVVRVPSAGTTVLKQTYSAIDPNPAVGKNYYRLKQTDYDGKTSVSELIKVNFEATSLLLQVYPNPIHDQIVTVNLQGAEPNLPVRVEIKNLVGQLIKSESLQTNEAGSAISNINLNHVPAGIYWVIAGGKAQKLIVK